MSHRIHLCVRATLAAALPLVSSTVLAQELQEVVVTAQKREQNIQNVPIAISAFTADTLQDKGVTDLHSLSNLTPNVNLDAGAPFSGDSNVLSASIRGIGQDDFAFNLDPGVGVYLDGVYLARTIGANQNLLDVERIEIAKGPQGTLFGRNTIGGAINIVTHTPGTERRFTAQATTGRFDRRDFAFTADLPVSDKLLTSITGSWLKRDGYQKVIPFPSSVPFVTDPVRAYPKAGYDTSDTNGGIDQQVLRGKMVWNASDTFSLTFAGDWQHQDQSATPSTVLSVQNGPANIFAFLYNTCISNSPAALNDPVNGPAAFISPVVTNTTTGVCGPRAVVPGLSTGGPPLAGAGYVNGPGGNLLLSNSPRIFWNFENTQTGSIDTTYSNGVSFAKNDAFGLAVTGDWQLGDGLSFKSITGYRQINWRVGVDLDGLPEQIQEVTDHQHQFQVSQEFQLNGKAFGDRLNYVTGLYFFKEKGYVHDYVPFEGILYVYDYQNDVDTKSYAAYFHTDYKLTDPLTLTIGGRYSREQKKFIGGQADLNGFTYKISGCNPPSDPANLHLDPNIPAGVTCQQALGFPVEGNPLRYFPTGTNEQTFDVFTPKVGLQYQFTNDVMGYVSWSKGFKSGGWTTRLSQPIQSGEEAEFGPEFAYTSELGVKSELFQRRLLVNTAIFYTDYKGIQLNFQEGASPVLHNAGNARIKGIELESQGILGGGFSFTLAAGYIDAKYTKIAPEAQIPITNKLPKTPRYKYTIGPNYDISLPNGAGMRFSVDYTRTADLFNDSLNTPELHRPATNALGASIHYRGQDERYEIVLGGTNLTNDRWLQSGSINLAAGEKVGTYNRPLEWYLTGRIRFGQ
ncbi:MAG TPA: TonB-dependent receptor [Steroidobacteraceae bacterium]|jgi:iron complex outermembrane receptor protein|nr:TonB-dependent receptor [Steroidobacteraceae bacterium]